MEHSLDIGRAIIIGLVQALTEFLPVSSSGHLVIAKSLLKIEEVGITLEIVSHLATALAVVIYMRKRIGGILAAVFLRVARPRAPMTEGRRADFRTFLLVIVGSVPAAVLGLAFNDFLEGLFDDLVGTGVTLAVSGVFLLLTSRKIRERVELRMPQALLVGVAQAIAIIPGISRSGLTVGTGLALGVSRRAAFEYSLLLSVPAILGASAVEALSGGIGGDLIQVAAAGVTALVGGYVAITLLFKTVVNNKFHVFGYYLIPVGTLVAVLAGMR
jgi:undecaprenyl-diphosphatase